MDNRPDQTSKSEQPDFAPERFFSRPDLFLMEFTAHGGNLVPMDRESYLRSIFTDRGRIVPARQAAWEVGLTDLLQGYESHAPRRRPLNYVFHVAHCGSTLLARALDIADRTLVIREPFALRQLGADAAAQPGGPRDPDDWSRRLGLVSGLLGRTWGPAQAAIVKANVPVNFIIPRLMQLEEGNRGILLYAELERYLVSVLKSPMHQRWVMNVLGHIAGAVMTTAPFDKINLAAMTPPQAAACLWLVQMYRFADALSGEPRLKSLNCEDLFSRPFDTLTAAFAHFDIEIDEEDVRAIIDGGLFGRHAKIPDRPYDKDTRDAELEASKRRLATEIKSAVSWAEQVLSKRAVDLPLAHPLLN